MNTLVIVDEPASRAALVGLCQQHPELGDAIAVSSGSAVKMNLASRPNLVIVDAELRDMTSFDVITALAPSPAIIMVGSRDEQASRAFDVGAIDFLRKPVQSKRFRIAVARYNAHAAAGPAPNADFGQRRLLAEQARRKYFVPISAIDYISSQGNYVTLHCGDQAYLRRDSVKSLALVLVPLGFEYIRRDLIVNIARVAFAEKRGPRVTEFTLLTGVRLLSRVGFRLAHR